MMFSNNKFQRFSSHLFIRCALFFLIVVLIAACAPDTKRETIELVWPLPPEKPRIQFVDILQNNKDVGESGSLGKILFGETDAYGLMKPFSVAVDRDGRVLVTDIGRVFVFDKKNKKLSFIGETPGTGNLRTPLGISVLSNGTVYVADPSVQRILMYNKNGKFLTAVGSKGELEHPVSVSIDEERKRFYVVDSRGHDVKAYTLDGKFLFNFGKRGHGEGEFNFPTHSALNSEGNLHVVDTQNFRVQVFDPEGNHLRTIGSIGDAPGSFARPKGIAIDSEDHIYVVDAAFQNVQIFDKEGRLLLFFGEGGPAPGQFSLPSGIYIDDEDKIYVADTFNKRVQVFQYLGKKWEKSQLLKKRREKNTENERIEEK